MIWDPPCPVPSSSALFGLQVTRQPQVSWTAMPSPHASRLAGALVQPPGSLLVPSPSLHCMLVWILGQVSLIWQARRTSGLRGAPRTEPALSH